MRKYRSMVAPGSAVSDVAVDVWLEQMERLPRAFLQVLNETAHVESRKPARLMRRLEAVANPARQRLPGAPRPQVRTVQPASPVRSVGEQLEALGETRETSAHDVSRVSPQKTATFSTLDTPGVRQNESVRHPAGVGGETSHAPKP